MYKSCNFECSVDPEVVGMDIDAFRGYVNDNCLPVFWEALNKARTRAEVVDPVLDADMRSGDAGMSCSADSHGNWGCEGHVTIHF